MSVDSQVHVEELRSLTLEHLRSCKAEFGRLVKTARTLGIEGDVIARYDGQTVGATTPARRRRSRPRSNGAGTVTGEQILGALQNEPMNQSQLAEMFGTTRQTVAKHLAAFVRDGHVITEGQGARKVWRARELQPA